MYLKNIPLHGSGYGHIVDQTVYPSQLAAPLLSRQPYSPQVDSILAQSDTTGVRAYGLAKLGCHKEHSEYLADTSETTRINLNDIDCVRLEELLEHHAIMCVFASGNANAVRFEFASDAGMTEDTVDNVSVTTGVGRKRMRRIGISNAERTRQAQ